MEDTGQHEPDSLTPESDSAPDFAAKELAVPKANVVMEPSSAASVVAVVVTHNPLPVLRDTLASLVTQDFQGLSILVIDDGSTEPIVDLVGSVAPGTFVRRLDAPIGFGAAANMVLEMIEGATHFLFCHDDVALAPDAVRLLVSAAISQDAAVAGPKVVSWENHERFRSLGYALDGTGSPIPLVELAELDQGQHDQIREVTAVHGAALLISSTTFAKLGGFASALTKPERAFAMAGGPDVGEDLDFCLRTRKAGERVLVVPPARVAHLSAVHRVANLAGEEPVVATPPGQPAPRESEPVVVAQHRVVRSRNRIRSMIASSGATRLVVLLPMLLFQALRRGAPPSGAIPGSRSTALSILRLALSDREVRRALRTQADRSGDGDLGREFVAVGGKLRASVRSDINDDSRRLWKAAERTLGSRRGGRFVVGLFALVSLVVLFGSRGLLSNGMGRGGRFVPLPHAGDLWRIFLSGWHETNLGRFGIASPGLGILAIISALTLGATGLVSTLLALAPIPLGVLGVYRSAIVAQRADHENGRGGVALAAALVYLLVPIPYDALFVGHRGALWGYALLPWLIRSMQQQIVAPSESITLRRYSVSNPKIAVVLRSSLVLAIGTSFDSAFIIVWVLTVLLLTIGRLLTSSRTQAQRAARHGLVVLVGTLVLLLPWVITLVRAGVRGWSIVGDNSAQTSPLGIGELLRFHTTPGGPIGTAVLAGIFLIAAAFPLFVADGDRLLLTIRCWVLFVGSVIVAWLNGRGWFPNLGSPMLLLLPGAFGVARAGAEGLGALVGEVRRRGFGWRQGFAGLAFASVIASAMPVVAAAGNGRWHRPGRISVEKLSWMRSQTNQGGFRVAYLGDPRVLPATATKLSPTVGVAVTRDGLPTIDDQWSAVPNARVNDLVSDFGRARLGATTRLGAELATLGIRYLVVVERLAPNTRFRPIPSDLRQALLEQLDLRSVDSGGDVTVYENDAWLPLVWSPLIATELQANDTVNTAGASNAMLAPQDSAVFDRKGGIRPPKSDFVGTLQKGAVIIASVPPDNRWTLRRGSRTYSPVSLSGYVDASGTARTGAQFAGFVNETDTGPATLRPERPTPVTLSLLFLLFAWGASLLLLLRDRRRRRNEPLVDSVGESADDLEIAARDDVFQDDEFADPFPSGAISTRRVAPVSETTPEISVAEELWSRFSERQGMGEQDSADDEDSLGAGRTRRKGRR